MAVWVLAFARTVVVLDMELMAVVVLDMELMG
jgi:hypothetical protein